MRHNNFPDGDIITSNPADNQNETKQIVLNKCWNNWT